MKRISKFLLILSLAYIIASAVFMYRGFLYYRSYDSRIEKECRVNQVTKLQSGQLIVCATYEQYTKFISKGESIPKYGI